MEKMMNYFKYVGPNGIDILMNKRLKVSTLPEINDPFEFLLSFDPRISRDIVYRQIRNADVIEGAYLVAQKKGVFKGSIEKFKKWVPSNYDFFYDELVDEYPKHAKDMVNTIKSEQAKKFGLICLTENENNLLMWSHYTTNHTGFLFEFDLEHLFKTKLDLNKVLIKVEYSEKRIVYPATLSAYGTETKKIFIEAIKTKAAVWEYEKEYRILCNLSNIIKEEENYFIGINLSGVRRIIGGCNTKQSDIMNISNYLKQNKLDHIQFEIARLDNFEYFLRYGTTK